MSEIRPGRFITLEGGEGAGKSTLQATLAARLGDLGLEALQTREPGGTPLAEAIRSLLLHPPKDETWTPLAEALLVNAARSDHLEKQIRPALAAGKWVICDRFSDSTRVYQGIGGGVPDSVLAMMERAVVASTMPDLTLILDVPVEAAQARRATRDVTPDTFEKRPVDFHAAVRLAFAKIARDEPVRCRLLDASRSANEVADQAWRVVAETLLSHEVLP